MKARSLFIGGTASHVGKSWMATAVCRWLRNRGVRVAPFKAQNMSNNSCPAADGGEIGRAQAAQAEACGLEPVTDMNPILLKPHSIEGSQVVLNGLVWRDLSAGAYYEHFEYLLSCVLASYERLASSYEFLVIEGAGSVAEVNLRKRDLVNFGLAQRVGAPALLVADIDRGGVFASLTGTLDLLTEEERQMVRSFAINRFRGDLKLFADGVDFLEERTRKPCLGVFPAASGIRLEDEDAVALEGAGGCGAETAILRLPHISNFTDFDRVQADWIADPVRRLYSHVILPGTKNTTGDLDWMRSRGLDEWVVRQHAAGAMIIGICGGYQILGESIEEDGRVHRGLGLLPASTVMQAEKTVRRVTATTPGGARYEAYEIHAGKTHTEVGAAPFAWIGVRPEGLRVGRCYGTYLHGALRSDRVAAELGLNMDCAEPKEKTYDALAAWFDQHADTARFMELYL